MNFASLEANLKAGLAKVETLLYTPQTSHPLLDDLRVLLVQQIQEHLGAVAQSAAALGNQILMQVEASLTGQGAAPPAPPASKPPAPPAK